VLFCNKDADTPPNEVNKELDSSCYYVGLTTKVVTSNALYEKLDTHINAVEIVMDCP
jgi:hypothetical protein